MSVSIVTVKASNSCQRYYHKFLIYDKIVLNEEDKRINEIVKEALSHLKVCEEGNGEVLKISVDIKNKIQE